VSTETFDGGVVAKSPGRNPRTDRARLSVEEASALFGAAVIRALGPSRQAYQQWKERGVPWEIVGPLFMARASLSPQHSQQASQGGADMHVVSEAQGLVFQLARRYGVRSTEFQVLMNMLTAYIPAAGLPRRAAGPPTRRASTTDRQRGTGD
jgi:hypothetical protein